MSTRSSRRPQSHPPLTSVESLLLAQATWELGAAQSSWQQIAKLLSKHPLISRPKSFFTAQSCHSMYEILLKDAGLEMTEANNPPHADINLKLSQKHYKSRFQELRDLILAEEIKFKTVLQEIVEIRAGSWDKKIKAKIEGEPLAEQDTLDDPNKQEAEETLAAQPQDVQEHNQTEHAPQGEDVRVKESHPPGDSDVEMKELEAVQEATNADQEATNADQDSEQFAQRQEEEEEDTRAQEETKEEEEEAGSHESSELVDVEKTDVQGAGSPQSGRNTDETESEPRHTPVAPSPGIDDEEHGSETEEPIVATRRSTRQRKMSGAPAPAPAPAPSRQRRGKAKAEPESQPPESDNDDTEENTPAREDDRTSSPFDTGSLKKRDGKRKASYIVDNVDSPQDKKRMREDSEPADEEEPGPSSHNTRARAARVATRTEEQKRFQNVITMLHSQISQHRNGTIFHNPIKPSEAPDYQEIVKRPMDLKTIKTRVKDGIIGNSLEFQRDIYLMFANAMMYNRPGSDVHGMAEDMLFDSEAQVNAFRQTEGLVKRVGTSSSSEGSSTSPPSTSQNDTCAYLTSDCFERSIVHAKGRFTLSNIADCSGFWAELIRLDFAPSNSACSDQTLVGDQVSAGPSLDALLTYWKRNVTPNTNPRHGGIFKMAMWYCESELYPDAIQSLEACLRTRKLLNLSANLAVKILRDPGLTSLDLDVETWFETQEASRDVRMAIFKGTPGIGVVAHRPAPHRRLCHLPEITGFVYYALTPSGEGDLSEKMASFMKALQQNFPYFYATLG
ncbi:hypothetical protein CPB83DRAFT_889287 [Crepidotus variabilis]|uniref:Bromo domain-containing protein n=1 Tax=Crepidotus variabilis TaxID=179855 RepID=A0A9P6JUH5_9AGAR|nr:hypothetical protein CPB83DRAFT_889287 [Crepidotus variabilis]